MKVKKDEVNNAIVTTLINVRPHNNADRLQLATCVGAAVVVGLDAKEGDPVIYFDPNLALSPGYLKENNLYDKSELNKDTEKKGYFSKNGRVRAQKFRGEQSNGFTASVESVAELCGVYIKELLDGLEFQELNDVEVCKKYVTAQKTAGMKGSRKAQVNYATKMFPKHWDTKHFMRCLETIPRGLIYLEEKIHGTSGRMVYAQVERNIPWYEHLLSKLGIKIDLFEWLRLHGSRNVTLTKPNIKKKKFDNALTCREEIFKRIAANLRKGEQIYYEIAGFEIGGGFIQKGFPYGCKAGEHRVFLYRVTSINQDGDQVDMSREYVYKRAEELGMEVPPIFERAYYYDGDVGKLIELVESYTSGRSTLDTETIREGVVVWFDSTHGWTCLKNKSFEFLEFESRHKEDKDFVDPEEEG